MPIHQTELVECKASLKNSDIKTVRFREDEEFRSEQKFLIKQNIVDEKPITFNVMIWEPCKPEITVGTADFDLGKLFGDQFTK